MGPFTFNFKGDKIDLEEYIKISQFTNKFTVLYATVVHKVRST